VHEPRFADLAPAQVYAMLLDEGGYLCSQRSIYCILAANAKCENDAISCAIRSLASAC
jgi:hypothetical protein